MYLLGEVGWRGYVVLIVVTGDGDSDAGGDCWRGMRGIYVTSFFGLGADVPFDVLVNVNCGWSMCRLF